MKQPLLNLARKLVRGYLLLLVPFSLLTLLCISQLFWWLILSYGVLLIWSGSAPVLLPAKVAHTLNLNIDDLNGANQQRFTNAFASDFGELVFTV